MDAAACGADYIQSLETRIICLNFTERIRHEQHENCQEHRRVGHYKLSDAQGNLIEESHEPMVYLHGGYENTLPKIEEALDGQEAGYETTIQVEPEDAFGEYDPELVKVEPRDRLPEPLEVGMQFEGTPDGDDDMTTR